MRVHEMLATRLKACEETLHKEISSKVPRFVSKPRAKGSDEEDDELLDEDVSGDEGDVLE